MASRSQSTKSVTRQAIERWEECNKLYFGPERDTKNFPHPVMAERHPPTKFGFIPQSYFDAFYEKTGVTGPYVLSLGVVTTLLSKEIWVAQHSMAEVFSFWLAIIYIQRKWGSKISAYFDKVVGQHYDNKYTEPVQAVREAASESIKAAEKEIDSAKCQEFVFAAQKENIDLQLEAVYRARLNDVYKQVKSRMDYQVEKQNVKRRFEQTHMVNWIVDNAVKGITPQQEKESITRCIKDLKALAAAQ